MSEVTIQLPEEKTVEVEGEKTVMEQALEVVEVAQEIAEAITEKTEEEDRQVFLVIDKLDSILAAVSLLQISFTELAAKVDAIQAQEVAEIIVEETPETITEIEAVADLIEEQEPETVVEQVPVAVTPQIKKKKATKWL